MAGQWDLSDDAVYPWRLDGQTWLNPLVTRDAMPGGPSPQAGTASPSYADPGPDLSGNESYHHTGTLSWSNPGTYTGAIIGAPNPAGYDRYFNFKQPVYEFCCDVSLVIDDCNWFYLAGWGQLSADPIPPAATQWTNKQDGCELMGGAFQIQTGDGGVVIQKWAETLDDWPSVNYARPFGRDRFLIDYAAVTDPDNSCTGLGISAQNYIGDIVTDATVDANHANLYANRRFPTCRPIGSTLDISSAIQTSPGVITITTAENHWLLAGDSLDFYSVSGLGTAVAVVTTAEPGTDNTFTVAGTLTGAYSGGGYVASHGTSATDWKWDWTCSRHKFLEQQWQTDYRGSGSIIYSESQGTLTPAMRASVLYFTPNSETFPNGYAGTWGSALVFENCPSYGRNEWHGKFLQAAPDPFFKAPAHCAGDSGDPFNLAQDPAPCLDGSTAHTTYYKYPPMVEPMLAAPSGAPSIPVAFASFDGGMPSKSGVPCAENKDTGGTQHDVYTAQSDPACTEWKDVLHYKCVDLTPP